MSIQAGDAFAFLVNSHRQQWNGKICSQPMEYKCGAEADFKLNHCEQGNKSCFHLNLFADTGPKFLTPDTGTVKLLADYPSLLEQQIILFYGQYFDLEKGRQDHLGQAFYGAYRVRRAYLYRPGNGTPQLAIEPHEGEWCVFPHNLIRRNKVGIETVSSDSSYLRFINGHDVRKILEKARAPIPHDSEITTEQQSQLERFCTSYERTWYKEARERLLQHPLTQAKVYSSGSTAPVDPPMAEGLRRLRSIFIPRKAHDEAEKPTKDEIEDNTSAATVSPLAQPATAEIKHEENWWRPALPEPDCLSALQSRYGGRLLKALQVASLSKSLIIVTGMPGVGKSWLASRLINDPGRERSEIVPVSSTWRGREDLLGYVNPVNGEFEPTSFARFLLRAQQAWDAGDRRVRLVVFEEFNLSQPEHWLSDLLVRLEFDPAHRADRTITLGGSRIAGEPEQQETRIYLPPSLVLVATLNNDHTVRPLSLRVLDRAALIEVSATGRAALEQVGMKMTTGIMERVDALNRLLQLHGVAFSVRSARSLLHATQRLGEEELMSVLDHVLTQEVLSKVRLIKGDPRDETLLQDLLTWCQHPDCEELALCRDRIAAWEQTLESGRDVFQG